MGTPLVGIYGPTRPERNGPLGADDEAVSRASICQCHHLRQCRLERMCLLDIDVAEVLDAVERRLRGCGTPPWLISRGRLARLRVPLGFLFAILVLWMARPTGVTLLAGSTIAAAG